MTTLCGIPGRPRVLQGPERSRVSTVGRAALPCVGGEQQKPSASPRAAGDTEEERRREARAHSLVHLPHPGLAYLSLNSQTLGVVNVDFDNILKF